MSDRILIQFVGGPAHGQSQWHIGGNYIEVVESPPAMLTPLTDAPASLVLRKFLYRIDTVPQPGGAYLARVQPWKA